jgi:hypothetical protein
MDKKERWYPKLYKREDWSKELEKQKFEREVIKAKPVSLFITRFSCNIVDFTKYKKNRGL